MRSSFGRAFVSVVTTIFVLLLLVGISFQLLAANYLRQRAVAELKDEAAVVADIASAAYHDGKIVNHDFMVALSVASQLADSDAIVYDAQGNLLLCSDSPLGCDHQGMKLDEKYRDRVLSTGCAVDRCTMEGLYEDTRHLVSVPIYDKATSRLIGIAMVSSATGNMNAIISGISYIFLYVSLFAVALSLMLTGIIARRQSTPMKELADTAREFGHGNLKARVKMEDNYPMEMEELAVAFNNMAASIEHSEYQRQEFVANVSHELKTPMTTISGYVDGILDGTIPQERQAYYLQVVSDETKRLNRLVRSMLDISRLRDEGGIPEEQKLHFDLAECVGQVLITFEQKIVGKELDVRVAMPDHPVYTIAHKDYVTQVVYNLVDNAVKFCPQGGVLALNIQEGGNKVYISIANDGPTIPAEEMPLVFDRFHKMDKSRSQNRDSWGLGLYIAKTIVDSHGENISVASRDGRTTFTFTMPLVN